MKPASATTLTSSPLTGSSTSTNERSSHDAKPPANLNFPSHAFVLSAGSVLFRTHPTTGQLEICVVHNTHRKSNAWILPKGRKDQGESMATTAVRETYEETGYPCELFPCTIPTRSPYPGKSLKPYVILEAKDSVEPFYMTVRELKDGSLKQVWWYITWLQGNSAEKVEGVSMPSEEGYESEFVDVPRALEVFEGSFFKEIVIKAVDLVTKALRESSME